MAAGACGGWLAAQARVEDAPASPASVTLEKIVETVSVPQAGNAGPPPTAARERFIPHEAAARADRDLAAAEKIIARIAAATPEELKAIYGQMNIFGHTVSRQLVRTAYMQRWVETDPEAGMAWLMKKNGGEDRYLLAAWLRMNPSSAAAWSKEHPSVRPWLDLHFSASADELQAVIQAALANPDSLGEPDPRSFRLDLLAQMNPDAALTVFASVAANDPRRSRMAASLAEGMAISDPAAALSWLRNQNLIDGLDDALSIVLKSCAWRNPDLVLRELETAGLPEKRVRELRDVIASGMAGKGPQALQTWLASLANDSIGTSNYVSIRGMKAGGMKLADMHALMQQMQRTGARIEASSLWDWTGRDPAKEFIAAGSLPDDAARDKLIASLRQAVAISGPLPKPEEMAALPEKLRADTALQFAQRAASLGNDEEAAKWLTLAPAKSIVEKLRRLPEAWVSEPHEATVALYGRLSPEERLQCAVGVAERITRNSPEEAISWMEKLPPAEQPAAWEGIADGMAKADEAAAARWVQSLPDNASRDGAVSRLTRHLTYSDPAAALQWALTIRDAKMRSRSLNEVATFWTAADREAAVQAFAAAEMSPEDHAVINGVTNKKEDE